MSDDGGLEELAEFFVAAASLATMSANRSFNEATSRSNSRHLGQPGYSA